MLTGEECVTCQGQFCVGTSLYVFKHTHTHSYTHTEDKKSIAYVFIKSIQNILKLGMIQLRNDAIPTAILCVASDRV